MSITKQDYIYRSLKKISHKGWEAFVISRILHGLDDDEIEFVTQQVVVRDDAWSFTDLYFPQFALHLEIDEGYHEKKEQIEKDKLRQQDIVQKTGGHEVRRIKIAEKANGSDQDKALDRDLDEIRRDVDVFVSHVKKLKKKAIKENRFNPWDLETRYLSAPIIKRGYLDIDDNVVFQHQIEALRCFGFRGRGYQRGAWRIPDGTNDVVWFPRLYEHGMWINQLVDNGKVILEEALNGNADGVKSIAKQRSDGEKFPDRKWIVFAKARDPLGFNLLRYVGTFQMNLKDSTKTCLRFDRIRTREPVRYHQSGA